VYPSYLVSGSAVVLIFVAVRLHGTPIPTTAQPASSPATVAAAATAPLTLIGYPALVSVLLVQVCKLFRLVGFSTEFCVSLMVVGTAYTAPYVLYGPDLIACLYASMGPAPRGPAPVPSARPTPGQLPSTGVGESIFYIAYAAQATLWARTHVAGTVMDTLLSRRSDDIQCDALCLACWLLFTATFAGIFMRPTGTLGEMLRSLCLVGAGVSALVAAQAVPLPAFLGGAGHASGEGVEWGADAYFANAREVQGLASDSADDHSAFFLLVATAMAMCSWANLFPVRKPVPRLLFLLWFSYCTARAALGWCFPQGLSADAPHTGTLQLPWVMCLSAAALGTSTALHATLRDAASGARGARFKEVSAAATWIFSAFCLLPVVGLTWALLEDSLPEHLEGVLSLAAAQFLLLGGAIRATDLFFVLSRGSPAPNGAVAQKGTTRFGPVGGASFADQADPAVGPRGSPFKGPGTSVATAVGLSSSYSHGPLESLLSTSAAWPPADSFPATTATLCGLWGFVWTAAACWTSPDIHSDLGVALSTCVLALADRSTLAVVLPLHRLGGGDGSRAPLSQVHGAGAVASMWLVLSALYSLLVSDSDLGEMIFQSAAHSQAGLRSASAGMLDEMASLAFLPDRVVSVWSASGWLEPTLAMLGLVLPLPAIAAALVQRRDDSDDLIFVLALLSALGTMLAPLWSLRLLGVMGVLLGSRRLTELGAMRKISDRIL